MSEDQYRGFKKSRSVPEEAELYKELSKAAPDLKFFSETKKFKELMISDVSTPTHSDKSCSDSFSDSSADFEKELADSKQPQVEDIEKLITQVQSG